MLHKVVEIPKCFIGGDTHGRPIGLEIYAIGLGVRMRGVRSRVNSVLWIWILNRKCKRSNLQPSIRHSSCKSIRFYPQFPPCTWVCLRFENWVSSPCITLIIQHVQDLSCHFLNYLLKPYGIVITLIMTQNCYCKKRFKNGIF